MVRRQFNIIHYVYFTAIASVVFAFLLSPSPQNLALAGAAVLTLSAALTVLLSPVLWLLRPLLPRSPESRLLHLPEDPEERIALLEGILARSLWLGSGAKRSVRVKLVQLFRERGRLRDAVDLGRETLARFRMSHSLESLLRLEVSICLDRLHRDSEARAQLEKLVDGLDGSPADALGWLVRGRLFDRLGRYDEAIAAFEKIMEMPLFERKPVQNEARRRLAEACVNAGRPKEAIQWAEHALLHEASRSGRFILHQTAAKAYATLGQADRNEGHKRQAREIAMANHAWQPLAGLMAADE
jgi:tetratricopeptide (TPR) repeat protein